MSKGINGCDLTKKHMVQAKKDFRSHIMREIGPGHWNIHIPGHSQYWADIVVMGSHHLVVTGDIELCAFAYYSGQHSPEGAVHWLFTPGLSYVCEKATIGMGSRELVYDYEQEVAIYDLLEHYREVGKNYCEDEWKDIQPEYKKAIDDAVESLEYGENVMNVLRSLHDEINEYDQDSWEWIDSVGRVPSPRVIWALAAIRRLSDLLKKESK